MNVNKIIITGNLTADPELRYTPSGKAVLSASIANNEHFTDAQGQEQKVTTFVNLEVWGRPAENFGKLVKKGQELFLDGRLRMDEWTDKQTNARCTRLYLLVENGVTARNGKYSVNGILSDIPSSGIFRVVDCVGFRSS